VIKVQPDFISLIGAGLAAGLAGTGVMMAMRCFDQRYAPKTIAKTRDDPGAFMVHAVERAAGIASAVPKSVEQSAMLAARTGYGALFGVIYGLWLGRGKRRSALGDGVVLGAAVYSAGHLGWLPALGLTKPVWKQEFSEVAGELLRHVAYGVTTAAAYGMIDAATRIPRHWPVRRRTVR
jgi:putative membrane protein